uniref:Uncharacterized protein n=1 Tax=Chromera velia CCMP2878 TaxID=1169474 RepID=A0A0G4I9A2_9ALVE|eukprot:Cvel_12187.t1-p1 / transcript=Cvel_12187.t1 / gene=Cvel_12187 / organism=Chromera_velia_CCMP2878 / gene_product=hypothetical protein / transcript_product=hypothetical protein / location=Cvel_scaffold787:45132-59446(-) / protein_length=1932 / sequence_SO=supercontig / SO=protein_coding / is_pseudo=false
MEEDSAPPRADSHAGGEVKLAQLEPTFPSSFPTAARCGKGGDGQGDGDEDMMSDVGEDGESLSLSLSFKSRGVEVAGGHGRDVDSMRGITSSGVDEQEEEEEEQQMVRMRDREVTEALMVLDFCGLRRAAEALASVGFSFDSRGKGGIGGSPEARSTERDVSPSAPSDPSALFAVDGGVERDGNGNHVGELKRGKESWDFGEGQEDTKTERGRDLERELRREEGQVEGEECDASGFLLLLAELDPVDLAVLMEAKASLDLRHFCRAAACLENFRGGRLETHPVAAFLSVYSKWMDAQKLWQEESIHERTKTNAEAFPFSAPPSGPPASSSLPAGASGPCTPENVRTLAEEARALLMLASEQSAAAIEAAADDQGGDWWSPLPASSVAISEEVASVGGDQTDKAKAESFFLSHWRRRQRRYEMRKEKTDGGFEEEEECGSDTELESGSGLEAFSVLSEDRASVWGLLLWMFGSLVLRLSHHASSSCLSLPLLEEALGALCESVWMFPLNVSAWTELSRVLLLLFEKGGGGTGTGKGRGGLSAKFDREGERGWEQGKSGSRLPEFLDSAEGFMGTVLRSAGRREPIRACFEPAGMSVARVAFVEVLVERGLYWEGLREVRKLLRECSADPGSGRGSGCLWGRSPRLLQLEARCVRVLGGTEEVLSQKLRLLQKCDPGGLQGTPMLARLLRCRLEERRAGWRKCSREGEESKTVSEAIETDKRKAIEREGTREGRGGNLRKKVKKQKKRERNKERKEAEFMTRLAIEAADRRGTGDAGTAHAVIAEWCRSRGDAAKALEAASAFLSLNEANVSALMLAGELLLNPPCKLRRRNKNSSLGSSSTERERERRGAPPQPPPNTATAMEAFWRASRSAPWRSEPWGAFAQALAMAATGGNAEKVTLSFVGSPARPPPASSGTGPDSHTNSSSDRKGVVALSFLERSAMNSFRPLDWVRLGVSLLSLSRREGLPPDSGSSSSSASVRRSWRAAVQRAEGEAVACLAVAWKLTERERVYREQLQKEGFMGSAEGDEEGEGKGWPFTASSWRDCGLSDLDEKKKKSGGERGKRKRGGRLAKENRVGSLERLVAGWRRMENEICAAGLPLPPAPLVPFLFPFGLSLRSSSSGGRDEGGTSGGQGQPPTRKLTAPFYKSLVESGVFGSDRGPGNSNNSVAAKEKDKERDGGEREKDKDRDRGESPHSGRASGPVEGLVGLMEAFVGEAVCRDDLDAGFRLSTAALLSLGTSPSPSPLSELGGEKEKEKERRDCIEREREQERLPSAALLLLHGGGMGMGMGLHGGGPGMGMQQLPPGGPPSPPSRQTRGEPREQKSTRKAPNATTNATTAAAAARFSSHGLSSGKAFIANSALYALTRLASRPRVQVESPTDPHSAVGLPLLLHGTGGKQEGEEGGKTVSHTTINSGSRWDKPGEPDGSLSTKTRQSHAHPQSKPLTTDTPSTTGRDRQKGGAESLRPEPPCPPCPPAPAPAAASPPRTNPSLSLSLSLSSSLLRPYPAVSTATATSASTATAEQLGGAGEAGGGHPVSADRSSQHQHHQQQQQPPTAEAQQQAETQRVRRDDRHTDRETERAQAHTHQSSSEAEAGRGSGAAVPAVPPGGPGGADARAKHRPAPLPVNHRHAPPPERERERDDRGSHPGGFSRRPPLPLPLPVSSSSREIERERERQAVVSAQVTSSTAPRHPASRQQHSPSEQSLSAEPEPPGADSLSSRPPPPPRAPPQAPPSPSPDGSVEEEREPRRERERPRDAAGRRRVEEDNGGQMRQQRAAVRGERERDRERERERWRARLEASHLVPVVHSRAYVGTRPSRMTGGGSRHGHGGWAAGGGRERDRIRERAETARDTNSRERERERDRHGETGRASAHLQRERERERERRWQGEASGTWGGPATASTSVRGEFDSQPHQSHSERDRGGGRDFRTRRW